MCELEEFRLAVLLQPNYGRFVAHLVAVIGCREDSNTLSAMSNFVSLRFHLVAADDQLQIVLRQKTCRHVGPERHTNPPLGHLASRERRRVRPQHVRHVRRVTGLPDPVNLLKLLQLDTVLPREAPVHDEHFVFNNVPEREVVENLPEQVIRIAAVLGLHLPRKSIHTIHIRGLMVPAVQVDVLGVQRLERKQCEDHFARETAAVHVVPVEKHASPLSGESHRLEDVQHIIILAVQVPPYYHVRLGQRLRRIRPIRCLVRHRDVVERLLRL
mmetsp:Transcript_27443/g.76717  ORF Transcript_27443/g.76717 Transcript_27443/m.76717 type:complete len:271 (-) Transcript_27443:709-1521(-)